MFENIFKLICLCVLVGAVFAAATALAVDPYVDTGFTPTTPRPDPDLVVVRERFYCAEGVDLSAFGLGGPHQYVQSIYFRLFVDGDASSLDSFTGLIVLPPDVTILGFITAGSLLGGEVDDGQWTQSDAIFGVGDDPDLYSEFARGFDVGSGVGYAEFIGQISSHVFTFGLNINSGVDDFRVVIDYGENFGTELSFDVLAYDVGVLGGAVPTEGIRVGDDADPVVFGSGDWGETPSLLGIPLTSTTLPVPADALPYEPLANLFILRDAGTTAYVDGYDTNHDIPIGNLFEVASNLSNPVGITDGEDGFLYAAGRGGGLTVIDPVARIVVSDVLDDLSGNVVDLTNVPGLTEIFLVRDTAGDTRVDVVDPAALSFLDELTVPFVTSPVGIADGPDGLLYVVGGSGTLAWLDHAGGSSGWIDLVPPEGSYADLTRLPETDLLFLLRDTAGDTAIDTYDVVTQAIVHGFSSFPSPSVPAGCTDGPDGHVHVIGVGDGGAAGYVEIDSQTGDVTVAHEIMDFYGPNVSLTNLAVLPVVGVGDTPRPNTLNHLAVPNPFNPRVEIRYELTRAAFAEVAVYDLRGQRVRVLRAAHEDPGWQAVSWDGRDAAGRELPSGTYLYRVRAGGAVGSSKIVLAK